MWGFTSGSPKLKRLWVDVFIYLFGPRLVSTESKSLIGGGVCLSWGHIWPWGHICPGWCLVTVSIWIPRCELTLRLRPECTAVCNFKPACFQFGGYSVRGEIRMIVFACMCIEVIFKTLLQRISCSTLCLGNFLDVYVLSSSHSFSLLLESWCCEFFVDSLHTQLQKHAPVCKYIVVRWKKKSLQLYYKKCLWFIESNFPCKKDLTL